MTVLIKKAAVDEEMVRTERRNQNVVVTFGKRFFDVVFN